MQKEKANANRRHQVEQAIARLNELCAIYLEEGEMEQFYDINADLDVLQSYLMFDNLVVEDSIKTILSRYL